ncbi:MLO-like protein 6 [Magnolia sinica]|uniref:MLO-like protein 6 n=1 Tax=Magnolia sinica TaxID=86752 RepID=UPI00265AF00C|nr:MLO-like protein 6 [Magnolia sinica]
MAGGGGEGTRSLEQTPTWAVAVVCFALVLISIFIEHIIHLIGKWLTKRHKRALYEALEKIKSELMLLGFISLLLTVGQAPISKICIPESVGNTWHPCKRNSTEGHQSTNNNEKTSSGDDSDDGVGRKLLWSSARRILAGGGTDKCAKGKVPLVSADGIHQLHIFIFVLAVFHVLYCISTMALGRLKMRSWKSWERETKTVEYQFSHDPERFRFARDTSFGRRHLNCWSHSPFLIWIVCFFRQFVRSVPKVDYLTLRHGFIMAHLAPQSSIKFDFQKYIKRSLEEDFKVVVGISPTIWFCAVLFLLFNTHGWYSYLWLPFIPLIIILLVGTKLQVIITRMGLQIQDRGDVVIKGVPIVQLTDNHFWFNRPRLLLFLIHFVLFQNAFQLAFFVWTWYEFGLSSCFHSRTEDVIIRISMGILIQCLCSYVTLPLYALVTQMGSNMKSTIFNERVATALRKWHHTARKHVKESRRSGSVTPLSMSRPATPTGGLSPVHLLRHYRSEVDSLQASPRFYGSDNERWDVEGSTSPSHRTLDGSSSHHHGRQDPIEQEREMEEMSSLPPPLVQANDAQHEININSVDFSFSKR